MRFTTTVNWILGVLVLFISTSCAKKTASASVAAPSFSADSAYAYVERQMMFGPRVPNSRAHAMCAAYLLDHMKQFSRLPEVQMGRLLDYKGEEQEILNVIGHFGPQDKQGRILLCAHYDCRPWSDEEEDYDNKYLPVPGANDGASGVGVLMEVARQLQTKDSLLKHPIDIVFFDCEDMGTPSFYLGVQRDDTWCLGSQLWASRLVQNGLQGEYQYGILLDMVGAPNAVFQKEYYSQHYANSYVEKIWRKAAELGYGQYFRQQETYPITDDHYYVNTIAGVPCVDIIHFEGNGSTGFPSWWHTQADNMQNIDRQTLKAVGEVVLAVIEK